MSETPKRWRLMDFDLGESDMDGFDEVVRARDYDALASRLAQVEQERDGARLVARQMMDRLDAAQTELQQAEARVQELEQERDEFEAQHQRNIETRRECARENLDLWAPVRALEQALRELRIDANRLCDRGLGGTYEDDCRRSIAKADAVLASSPTPEQS